jgi:polysaccharide export outer membrane protein
VRKTTTWVAVCLILTTTAWAQPSSDEPPDVAALSGEYKIGIEDVLSVSVWGEPDLKMTVRVRPDGNITFPLVNDIEVEGLTPEVVRARLTERLAEFIKQPNVTVIVEEINSYKVYVVGKVGIQGVYQFYRPTRLLQAIAQAGGFGDFAKQHVTVLRDKGFIETRINVNVKRLVEGDRAQENLFLLPGDTVVVD